MRTVLALLLVTAASCAGRSHTKPVLGPVIGQSTAPGPSNPSAPLALDPPDVTEGGGRLSGPVGSAPGSVTPTVGEQSSTTGQATTGSTGDGQPATVYAPTVGAGQPITTIPTAPARAPTPTTPVTGPVTGAGPNGPGTGTGPATPLGPATGANTPTPSTPNRR